MRASDYCCVLSHVRIPFVFTLLSLAAVCESLAGLTGESAESDLAGLESSYSQFGALRTSVGYRDNIFLSAFAPTSRTFGRGEAEFVISSLPLQAWQWTALLNGDVLRYFRAAPGAGGEQQWLVHGDLRWNGSERFFTTLAMQGYYQDMVLDLSETEAVRVVAPVKVRGAMLTASTHVPAPGGFALVPSVRAHWSDYLDYSADYQENQEGLRLEWKQSDLLVISAGGQLLQRNFSERTQYTAGGRSLPDTHLHFKQSSGDLKVQSSWIWLGKWTASAAASRMQNRDDGSGYFDYDRNRGKADIGWSTDRWSVTCGGDRQHSTYLVQTAGIGIAPPARVSTDTELSLRVERHFSSRWTVFAEGRHEQSTSNQEEFSYRARSISSGVELNF